MGPHPAHAQVSLGEQTIKQRVERRNKDGAIEVSDIEITAHDPSAANRALELLGRSGEVRLFEEAAAPTSTPVDAPREEGDHLAHLAKRWGYGGNASGQPISPRTQPSAGSPERSEHLERIARRYAVAGELKVIEGGAQTQPVTHRKKADEGR
jgi:hypothetical protein